jgi:hypothetical protein
MTERGGAEKRGRRAKLGKRTEIGPMQGFAGESRQGKTEKPGSNFDKPKCFSIFAPQINFLILII